MVIEALYLVSTGLTKMSILLFYRRLVPSTVSSTFVWSTRAVIFSVLAYIAIFGIILLKGCAPMNAFWNQVDPAWKRLHAGQYKCLDEPALLFAVNITSIIQDFLTFLMPMMLFWNLRLPTRQKVILQGLFGIGFL
jgi:hypothetical protein